MAKDDGGGFSKIAGGLSDLIKLLVDLDKDGGLPRSGRREKDGVVVEYKFGRRTADGSPEEAPAEDEASPPPPRKTAKRSPKRTEIEVVEPVTDEFDEPGEAVFLFELPGVRRQDIRCLLDGDILLLDAKAGDRLYRKEVLIQAKLAGDAPQLKLHNGVLEVRLKKQA